MIQSHRLLAAHSFVQMWSVTCWHIMQTHIVTLSSPSAEVWRRVVQVLSFWSVACCRCIYTYGASALFIPPEHTVSFVLSVHESAHEEIILSSWRGNEKVTQQHEMFFLLKRKKKKDIDTLLSYSGCFFFFGLSVSCWFKRLSRCGSLLWGPSCGANHFRVVLLHMFTGLTHLSRREGGSSSRRLNWDNKVILPWGETCFYRVNYQNKWQNFTVFILHLTGSVILISSRTISVFKVLVRLRRLVEGPWCSVCKLDRQRFAAKK